jgi:hypothetical protein
MYSKIIKIVLFAVSVFFLVGGSCPSNETTQSNKVAQTEIFQSYTVRENAGKLEVVAYFRIGGETGTTLALVAPSKILFNGQQLTENLNTGSGTFYTIEVPKNAETGTFQFTDRKGKVYTNKIELSKIATLAKNITANGTSPVSIPLSGSLSENSSLSVELSSPNNSENLFVGSIFETELAEDKKSLIVKPEAFKEFQKGNLVLKLDVTNSIPVEQGTNLGGSIAYSYKTNPVNISLTKTPKSTVSSAKASKSR